jgi:hypothetical protein
VPVQVGERRVRGRVSAPSLECAADMSVMREELTCVLCHRDNSRMFQSAVRGDRIELRLHCPGHADAHEAVLTAKLCFQYRGHRCESMSGARELTQQCVVFSKIR